MFKQGGSRLKRRYICVEIECEKKISYRDLQNAVWMSLLRYFGEYTASQTGLFLVEYDENMKRGIFRCFHKFLNLLKTSIVATTEINNSRAIIHILLVSGTLKAIRKKTRIC